MNTHAPDYRLWWPVSLRACGLNGRGLLFLIAGIGMGVALGSMMPSPKEGDDPGLLWWYGFLGGCLGILVHDVRRVVDVLWKAFGLGALLAMIGLVLFGALGAPLVEELGWVAAFLFGFGGFVLGFLLMMVGVTVWKERPIEVAELVPDAEVEAVGQVPDDQIPLRKLGGPTRCARCRARFLDPLLRREERLSFRSHKSFFCLRCWRLRRRRQALLPLAALAAVFLPGLVMVGFDPTDPVGGFMLNLGLFGLICTTLGVLHELGHVLAGWLAGGRLIQVYNGSGFTIYAHGRWGLTFDPDLAPVNAGWASVTFPNPDRFRRRYFLLVLGGPLVHVLFLFGALWWMSPAYLLSEMMTFGTRPVPGALFVAGNVLFLVLSLWPWRMRVGETELPSDGYHLLRIPFLPDDVGLQMHAGHFLMQGYDQLQRHQFAEASRSFEAGLHHCPQSSDLELYLAHASYREGNVDRARALWQSLLDRAETTPNHLECARLGVVWSDLLWLLQPGREEAERTRWGDEVDRLSQELVRQPPQDPAQLLVCLLTRGSALVELGQENEGADLLSRVLEQTESGDHRACGLSFLALAALRQGKPRRARKYLDEARTSDPTCEFLPPLERLLAEGGP